MYLWPGWRGRDTGFQNWDRELYIHPDRGQEGRSGPRGHVRLGHSWIQSDERIIVAVAAKFMRSGTTAAAAIEAAFSDRREKGEAQRFFGFVLKLHRGFDHVTTPFASAVLHKLSS